MSPDAAATPLWLYTASVVLGLVLGAVLVLAVRVLCDALALFHHRGLARVRSRHPRS